MGIDATLEQIETGVWHPKMTRLEYQVALNLTGVGIDDPDALRVTLLGMSLLLFVLMQPAPGNIIDIIFESAG